MSNIIKYNYIHMEDGKGKNVTSNYDGFFRTVEQMQAIQSNMQSVTDRLNDESQSDTDIGEILTNSNYTQSEAQQLERVLRQQEEFLNNRVDAVIAEANIKANMIIEQANDNARFIYDDSKKKGYEDGYREAKAQADKETQEIMLRYERLMQENEELLKKESELLENKIVESVCSALDSITGICISQYEQAIVSMISKTLQKCDNSSNYYIRVSSADFPVVIEHKKELMDCVREDSLMDILPDADMLPNQCIIETDGNVIDASLDEQLRNLKTNLRLLAGR